jgi:hypothetical protein
MAELRPPLRRSPGANRSAESAGPPRLADASAVATPGRCRAAVVAALELAARGLRPVGAGGARAGGTGPGARRVARDPLG